MAEYIRRVHVPPARVQFVLRNPTNWVEYDKAIRAADAELTRLGIKAADDTVTIEATETEIIISFELPEEE
jgi:hypothetical protein